ncbi:hypothetical protein CEXT_777672 [Caerostris extrusa]|uniref:Sorbin and SH3 domain-containing protein 2 n=1 Tax=Caerostris extrusa TaxID=172846 RepID=A0AAV4XGX2_CAEEX|nr:hypothetical protein CEXT_777672 [Caerostris extrusa]
MPKSRSQFYVDTPFNHDPPSQRHSITAGSVDRLTGLGEKKNPRFFTLKPKTSFSLRPLFSSTSSLSPSKKHRRKSIETTNPRRDSYVQTDQDDRVYDEVGVQTLNASTVDVPVQTCFREWEEDDRYSYYRRPFAAGAYRPGYNRWPPPVGYSSSTPSTPLLASVRSDPDPPPSTKNSVVAPLVSSKLLKYAAPGDSAAEKTLTTSATQGDVNKGITAKLQETPVVSVPSPSPLTVKYFTAKELTSSGVAVTPPLDTSFTKAQPVQENRSSESPVLSTTPVSEDNGKKVDEISEASSAIRVISQAVSTPPSALKVERTDSPVRHSAKIKTVHFDLSDTESPKNSPKIESKSKNIKDLSDKRNIDKDFIALLKDLDILTDDPSDVTENCADNKLTISFNAVPESALKQTILSSKLKSAFDILHQDVLPPILEHSNETSETELQVSDNFNETSTKPETNEKSESKKAEPILDSVPACSDNLQEDLCPVPSDKKDKKENELEVYENVPVNPTSPTLFTSSKFDSDVENCNNRENVYDSLIKKYTSETVPFPTLPSFFDSLPNYKKASVDLDAVEDTQTTSSVVSPITSQSAPEEKMLSRSSSRSSVRSNSRTDFNSKPFDSCENLDQLEEEIIKSLCDPINDSFDAIEVPDRFSPAVLGPFVSKSPNPSQMRSAILDRLLSGENTGAISPNNTRSSPVSSNKENTLRKLSNKHTATLTKRENPNYEFINPQIDDDYTNDPFDKISEIRSNENEKPKVFDNSGRSPLLNYSIKNVIESPKKNYVFLFPENNALSSEVAENPTAEAPKVELAGNTISDGSLNNAPLHATPIRQEISESSADDPRSKTCDFTNCLRPSELQNSPFLNKISSSSIAPRLSPEKTYIQPAISKSPVVRSASSDAKVPKPNGQCDYANCLKPSQVQNSLFTAELSELTASKTSNFGNDTLRTNSPLTARTNSPSPISRKFCQSPTILKKSNSIETAMLKDEKPQDVSHKSEVTIVLKTPEPFKPSHSPNEEVHSKEQSQDDGVIELPPVFSTTKEPVLPSNVITQSAKDSPSQVPPPPPPPPPPIAKLKTIDKNLNNDANSLGSMIRNAQSNLNKTETPCESKFPAPKTPVMMELEKRFETQRRNSSDTQNQEIRTPDASSTVKSELVIWPSPVKRTQSNGDNSFMNQTSPNATTERCNGSNGFYSEPKERSSSLPNGKSENNFNGKDHSFSSKPIITNEPPPPGAFLLDKKVTVDGDKVHTDKYYAIPVKEMLKETTTTTKFIPAPPKYEGIGPTEDGVPIGLRNSVKKENMHNWYKTMFKSLHKIDSALDGQEYTVGYSSEPETSKKDKFLQKKSATLDNRSGNNTSKTTDNIYKQNYPPSAKSSIEVYKVRPRLIEDYEPGHSSVTDDEITYSPKRYLPPLNTPKPSYEFKNGYEQDNNFIRNLSVSDGPDPEQQKVWYKEIQKGGDVPQFGLGKPAPEKPKEPIIGPLPPPPLNYHGPVISQAIRPATLPPNYQTDSSLCQQSNGPYEMHMRQAIHTEMQHRLSPSSSQLSSPSRSILKSPSRSPDLKLLARALFDFHAESSKEISLKKGDSVLVLRQLDKNWYEGEKHGHIGIFPISYVEIVPPEHTSTPIKSFTEGTAKVRFDFTAQTSVELSVQKGDLVNLIRRVDSNWYECRFNTKKGTLPTPPKSCLKSSSRSNSETNSNTSSPYLTNTRSPSVESAIHVDSRRAKIQGRSKKGYSLLEPVLYKAMYNYKPQNEDELELGEGDMIYVVEMCDDGWHKLHYICWTCMGYERYNFKVP